MKMAKRIVRSPFLASHMVFCSDPTMSKMMKERGRLSESLRMKKSTSFGQYPCEFRPIGIIKAAEQSSGLLGDEEMNRVESSGSRTVEEIKTEIYKAVQGINRGIFGVSSGRKNEIEGLVQQLESQNPNPDPALHLDRVGVEGCWKLVYSTITILGSKRTKLGLRDFITLGDFYQIIDLSKGKAVNVVKFNARGLNLLSGKLIIEASFKISSRSRVDISYNSSTITPDQLMNVFRKNYDLLLGIFNPEGWLEITYIDGTMRIGRDNKGNIFILERSTESIFLYATYFNGYYKDDWYI